MTANTNSLSQMRQLLSGYSGYGSMEEQRQTDARIKANISELLTQCLQGVETRLAHAREGSDIASNNALDRCRLRMNSLQVRLRYGEIPAAVCEIELTEGEIAEMMRWDLEILETVSDLESRLADMSAIEIQALLDHILYVLEERAGFMAEFQ